MIFELLCDKKLCRIQKCLFCALTPLVGIIIIGNRYFSLDLRPELSVTMQGVLTGPRRAYN